MSASLSAERLAEIRSVDLLALMSERAAGQISGYLAALLGEIDQIAVVLAQSEQELTGARLSLWEEEQDTKRLRVALESAKRGRRELRARLERRTVLLHDVQRIARGRTAEARGRKAYGERLKARVADLETGLALPWAATMSDDDLHGFLGDLIAAAMDRWRSDPEVPDRVTLANVEKACAGWRTPGQGFRSDDPETAPAASELTVFRASHPESGIVLDEYRTRPAAMDHVHHLLANEESTTPQAIELRVIWRADDPDADEPVWECWLHDEDGEDDKPTGYVVGPVIIAEAYDPDGDE